MYYNIVDWVPLFVPIYITCTCVLMRHYVTVVIEQQK